MAGFAKELVRRYGTLVLILLGACGDSRKPSPTNVAPPRPGTLEVLVQDTTLAPVPGVPITVEDTATGAIWYDDTGSDGLVTFVARAGNYEVTLAASDPMPFGARQDMVEIIADKTVPYKYTVHIPRGGSWLRLMELATPRAAHAVATDGETVYLAGGMRSPTSAIESVDRWQGPGSGWETVSTLPEAVTHADAVMLHGRLHVLGGYAGVSTTSTSLHQVYDPATGSWSTAAPLPEARARHAALVIGDRIHVLGGLGDDVASTHLVYDAASDTWSQAAPLPMPRTDVGAAVHGWRIFVIGGYAAGETVKRVDVYNSLTDRWHQEPAAITRRSHAAAVAVCDGIALIGGRNGSDLVNAAEWYDITQQSWHELRPMIVPRHGLAAVLRGPDVIISGGSTDPGDGVTSAVERLRLPCP